LSHYTLQYQHYPNHRPTYIVSLYFTIPALSLPSPHLHCLTILYTQTNNNRTKRILYTEIIFKQFINQTKQPCIVLVYVCYSKACSQLLTRRKFV